MNTVHLANYDKWALYANGDEIIAQSPHFVHRHPRDTAPGPTAPMPIQIGYRLANSYEEFSHEPFEYS